VQLPVARLLVVQQPLLRFRLMKEKASLTLMQTTVKKRRSHLCL
jgi:hypothetical protein